MNEDIVGGGDWDEKGHMELEAMGGQFSNSMCHCLLTESHSSAEQDIVILAFVCMCDQFQFGVFRRKDKTSKVPISQWFIDK